MIHGFLIRFGEIWLKKGHKDRFLSALVGNIRAACEPIGGLEVRTPRGRILVVSSDGKELGVRESRLRTAIGRIPGIQTFSPVTFCERDLQQVEKTVEEHARSIAAAHSEPSTFKVDTNRSDKRIEHSSSELNRRFGSAAGAVLDHWKVQLKAPEVEIGIELHRSFFCVFSRRLEGAGGLPVGASGRGIVLLSGGIDSPVAAWRAARRGLSLRGIHFYASPHTPRAAREKVLEIARTLSPWVGDLDPVMCDLGPFQRHCAEQAPRNTLVLLYRRQMCRIAQALAHGTGAQCLITGDNLGQVASQTIHNLGVIQNAVALPLLRPLLCSDKEDIVSEARELGTYRLSIEPFPDACSLFVPRNPETKARLEVIENVEKYVEWQKHLNDALEQIGYRPASMDPAS